MLKGQHPPCGDIGVNLRPRELSPAVPERELLPRGREQFRCCLLAGLFAAISGCSLWGSDEPSPPPSEVAKGFHYTLSLKADEDINRDGSGRAMPVLLNIFELRSPGNFEMSDYFDLHDNAQMRLGQDLLRSDQLMVWPGTSDQRKYSSPSPPVLLGVIAGYQQLDGRTWRVLIPIPSAVPAVESDGDPPADKAQSPDRDISIDVVIRQDGLHVLTPTLQE